MNYKDFFLSSKNLTQLWDVRKKCNLLLGASGAVDSKKKLFNTFIYCIEQFGTSKQSGHRKKKKYQKREKHDFHTLTIFFKSTYLFNSFYI